MSLADHAGTIAFYAPLKAPDHPVPSGDRRMGQLLFKALARAGFSPRLESRLRTYEPTGAEDAQEAMRRAAQEETERLLAHYARAPDKKPFLWFTYHSYYKAVDYIGPVIARVLSIPYCLAEASHAPRRAQGIFAPAHVANEAAIRAANAIFIMTAKDRIMLEPLRRKGQLLVDLPPFINHVLSPYAPRPPRSQVELLAVAMMRQGDKLESFRQLACALACVDRPWRLTIVGDGEARPQIEKFFEALTGQIIFRGRIDDAQALTALYRASDLLVWPAVNEAYGMVFLEAAAQGCPALAGSWGGVESVVIHEKTGILTPPEDVNAFAQALTMLIDNPSYRALLGGRAHALIAQERTLDHAAGIVRSAISSLSGSKIT